MKSKTKNKYIDLIVKELWENISPESRKINRITIEFLKEELLSDERNIRYRKRHGVFLPSKKYYQELATSRNRNLITQKQQKVLEKTLAAFFGMSVGSHAALTWMMLSRAKEIKISDPDVISPTNLNRLRFGWSTIGKLKTEVVKDQLEELNPYCKVYQYNGRDDREIKRIILGEPKPKIVIDSMDDIKSKVIVRLLARNNRIPVLMATDVGDNVFLDIERYDLSPRPSLFNGRVKNIEKIDFSKITKQKKLELSMQIVGLEHNSEEMLSSLFSLGKTLKTWPQLGSTATMAGGLLATVIKKIVLGEKVISGRYNLLLDDLIVQDYYSKKKILAREKLLSKLTSALD